MIIGNVKICRLRNRMNKILGHTIVTWISRVTLGLIFIVASIEKIALPDIFAANINAYGIIPFPMINIFALLLPWIELLCGVYLLAGVKVRSASLVISSMLVVFIVAILIAMAKGLTIDCGCFGSAHATPVGWPKVIEDVGMLLLGLHLMFFGEKRSFESVQPDL